MIHISDSHRFGLRVKETILDNGSWFEKPRSTWIEELFLCKESPINIFSTVFECSNPCEFRSKQQKNFSKSLVPFFAQRKKKDWIVNYSSNLGKLIAFSSFYGITDLHFENIKILDLDNQVVPVPIDIENCLVDLISCSETQLIPSNLISESACGSNGQLGSIHGQLNGVELLDSFILTFNKLLNYNRESLGRLFSNHTNNSIRVFLRDTKDYYLMQSTRSFPPDILASEKFQLLHGDIPYFFTTKDSGLLWYFSSVDVSAPVVESTFNDKMVKYRIGIDDFFSKRLETLFITSATHIVRIMKTQLGSYKGEMFEIEIKSNQKFKLNTNYFSSESTF